MREPIWPRRTNLRGKCWLCSVSHSLAGWRHEKTNVLNFLPNQHLSFLHLLNSTGLTSQFTSKYAAIYLLVYLLFILTPRTFFPSCLMEQGHQPLTDFWANRDLACSVLCGATSSTSSIIFREHFSGVLAGATMLHKSSSSVPGIAEDYTQNVIILKKVVSSLT